jgi:hypothetical protein
MVRHDGKRQQGHSEQQGLQYVVVTRLPLHGARYSVLQCSCSCLLSQPLPKHLCAVVHGHWPQCEHCSEITCAL